MATRTSDSHWTSNSSWLLLRRGLPRRLRRLSGFPEAVRSVKLLVVEPALSLTYDLETTLLEAKGLRVDGRLPGVTGGTTRVSFLRVSSFIEEEEADGRGFPYRSSNSPSSWRV